MLPTQTTSKTCPPVARLVNKIHCRGFAPRRCASADGVIDENGVQQKEVAHPTRPPGFPSLLPLLTTTGFG